MSISLKNHEDRIVSLEGKSSIGLGVKEYTTGNPGYILFNNGLCIQYGRNNFYASRNSNVSFAKTFSSILGSGHFCNTTNDRRPWECSSKYRNLTNSGFVIDQSGHDFVGVMYWIFIGTLTIYYIVRYNISRLTQILLDSPFFEGLSSQKGGARTI